MLSKLQKLREEREQGFTLIELLVVILIIGILAAIAIPAFLNQRKSGVDATVESDVKNAATAIETAAVKAQGQDYGFGTPTVTGNEYEVDLVDADSATIATVKTKVSKGTELTFTDTGDSYTVMGQNDGGDRAVSGITYNSANGGLATNTPAPVEGE